MNPPGSTASRRSPPVPQGLTTPEVPLARGRYGANVLSTETASGTLQTLREITTDPMFLLLVVACVLYGVLGQVAEGLLLVGAILLVGGISFYQSVKSANALRQLKKLTQPTVRVRRDGVLVSVPTEELVVGDAVWVEEGQPIPADGRLEQASDFTVDEALLTGEAVPVAKALAGDEALFAGTSVTSGSAWLRVTAVGQATALGRIGASMQAIAPTPTPLQAQIQQFVRRMAYLGIGAFVLVWTINYAHSGEWIASLLLSLTLAMSLVPEEIPVAFSSFMALGAARLSRMGVLTKQPQTVENLGSATVICTDKTGTITQNGMEVRVLYDYAAARRVPLDEARSATARRLLAYARWASETDPFDPMEKAIVAAFDRTGSGESAEGYPMQVEYPLEGSPPMMTHVRRGPQGTLVIAAKGAVERLVGVCALSAPEQERVLDVARHLSGDGYRVLGVAQGTAPGTAFPARQDDFAWAFLGLIALENPPKENAAAVVRAFGEAGIQVKMITGDYPETAQAIARQVGIPGADTLLTGREVQALDEPQLRAHVGRVAVFARMFPEAKLRVVEALKHNGEVVAMTGDGVNDGPALKAAHIGVSMGERGTEVARQAASLVLVHDDLMQMVEAVAQGRKIYQNLKKAISYIVSIHLPIILTVAVPLLLGWKFANLFTPIHVIFLELVMGPTCSIAFEAEPAEPHLMRQPPRPRASTFLNGPELLRSLAQGLVIAAAVLGVYAAAMRAGYAEAHVRTLVFVVIVMSNVFLTLSNRSFSESALRTLRRPNPLLWLMLGATLALLAVSLTVPFVQRLFAFQPITLGEMLGGTAVALVAVGWFEGYKWFRRRVSPLSAR